MFHANIYFSWILKNYDQGSGVTKETRKVKGSVEENDDFGWGANANLRR